MSDTYTVCRIAHVYNRHSDTPEYEEEAEYMVLPEARVQRIRRDQIRHVEGEAVLVTYTLDPIGQFEATDDAKQNGRRVDALIEDHEGENE